MNETISIPKGIASGQNIRMSGKGNQSDHGGEAGDLIIKLNVKPDPYFKRDGFDIVTNAYVTIAQAVLGDSIKVKTLDGEKDVRVENGA